MSDLNKIKCAAERYDDDHRDVPGEMPRTNKRLSALIDVHGVEKVSAASGLKVTSLLQYTKKSNPPPVSDYAVTKAETILSNI